MTEHPITPPTLTVTARHIRRLRDHLLREDEQERIAYVYCSPSGPDRLLADELVPVADDELKTQSPTACRPKLAVERDRLAACCRRDMHPLVVHSHPFDTGDAPRFSPFDWELMESLRELVTGLYPDHGIHTMFGVLSQQGLTTAGAPPDADTGTDAFTPVPVQVLGRHTLDPPLSTTATIDATPTINEQRHDRGLRAIGAHGQAQLAATHIGLVGAGGLGSIMAEELARYGIGGLTIVDPDVLEESNLNRVFNAADTDIGRPKVDIAAEAVHRANPDTAVTMVQDTAENAGDALKQCDLLVAGVDTVSARLWLTQFAVRHLLPLIDAGVIIRTDDEADDADTDAVTEAPAVTGMEGVIQTILPGATACYDCLNRFEPEEAHRERLSDAALEEVERGYVEETALSPAPAVVPLNGMVASKTVQVVAQHVTGYAEPPDFLHLETVANDCTAVTTSLRPDCPTCQPDDIMGRGDRTPSTEESVGQDLDLDPVAVPAPDTDPAP